jgi:hypothetical protein
VSGGAVGVFVGTGVIGEYFLGFCVAVGTAAAASVGRVRVGALTDGMTTAGATTACSPQAVRKKQSTTAGMRNLFITLKYSGGKLSPDEFPARAAKIWLTKCLKRLTYSRNKR